MMMGCIVKDRRLQQKDLTVAGQVYLLRVMAYHSARQVSYLRYLLDLCLTIAKYKFTASRNSFHWTVPLPRDGSLGTCYD